MKFWHSLHLPAGRRYFFRIADIVAVQAYPGEIRVVFRREPDRSMSVYTLYYESMEGYAADLESLLDALEE